MAVQNELRWSFSGTPGMPKLLFAPRAAGAHGIRATAAWVARWHNDHIAASSMHGMSLPRTAQACYKTGTVNFVKDEDGISPQ